MNPFSSKAEQGFWALAGDTFSGSYFEDQHQRMIDRPESKYQLGDLVTAPSNPRRKHRRDQRPDPAQISGIGWNGTINSYSYDVSMATESWANAATLSAGQLDQDWHQGMIDRRRKNHKSPDADRFHAELATFIEAGPEYQLGDIVMWDVPALVQKSRHHPLPPEVPVMIVEHSVRDRADWEYNDDGSRGPTQFSFEWRYMILPAIGICHRNTFADLLRPITD